MLLILRDIDGLKTVNDTFGHAAGDQVAGRRRDRLLQGTYRQRRHHRADRRRRVHRVPARSRPGERRDPDDRACTDNIARHNARWTRPFRLSMSVGVGRINPADCPTVQRLLAEADRELYRRKAERKAAGGTPSVG